MWFTSVRDLEKRLQANEAWVRKAKPKVERGAALRDLVAAAERDIILEALEANDSHISNTAKELHLERSHLYKKMKSLGINPRES